ncbi:AI-2E family transporter [Oscillatoria salina]|uniref:AI-2E family transporter n=1 Tax=Oscillatoria salina TaxID=331517 RepID=UPI0013B62E79|nr:AI-2E family transporter [Oscillatoria salina]MBZ8179404.1 AI-2E family transporter [Oscillatoria salina IIICB1]NET87857.1 AI-2E family transporter [Kamptonema sp. SIO1D9]
MSTGKFLGFVAIAISLYILWQIRQVLLLAFLAIALATVINRLVQLLQKFKIKRGIAVTISVILVLALFVGFIAIIVPSIIDQWQQLVNLVPESLEQLREWYSWLQNLIPGQLLQDIEDLGDLRTLLENISANDTGWFSGFFRIFSNSINFILKTLLVIVVTIMLLANPSAYRHVFLLLFPAFYRQRADDILSQCEEALTGWFKGILFNMTVITIFSGIGLLLLGIPLALVNALIAGILTFIPNLGPTLSVIPPAALGLLEAPWKAIAVIVLYIVIQQIESDVLTPLVMKNQVSLLPAITLLSQVTFAIFFGALGLFLALPIIIVAQVWLKELLVKDILNHWENPRQNSNSNFSDGRENQANKYS